MQAKDFVCLNGEKSIVSHNKLPRKNKNSQQQIWALVLLLCKSKLFFTHIFIFRGVVRWPEFPGIITKHCYVQKHKWKISSIFFFLRTRKTHFTNGLQLTKLHILLRYKRVPFAIVPRLSVSPFWPLGSLLCFILPPLEDFCNKEIEEYLK